MLLVVYLAKQAIYVVAFPPFSGHDEVAHYAYLRTVATEGRIPVLPDLAAWRAARDDGEEPPFDRLPDELYPTAATPSTGTANREHPTWSRNPPRAVTYLDELYPSGYQYAANHPPLYYFVMTPLYWLSAGLSPVVQHYLLRVAAIPFGLATVLLAYPAGADALPRRRVSGGHRAGVRRLPAADFVRGGDGQQRHRRDRALLV